jgi:hypothetical protein
MPQLGDFVRNRGLETSRFEGGTGVILRRDFPASPDGFPSFDILDPSLEVLLGRARAGTSVLRPATLGGRTTLRGRLRLGPNDCAGLRGGVKTIDLNPRTLLPLRILTQRAGDLSQTQRIRYLSVNRALPAGAFRAVRVGPNPFREDRGFRRTGPARAAQNLSYTPQLPTTLPAGFRRAVTGWAPRSAIVGPEGSIPPRNDLFAAVYTRGWERIALTQRRAKAGDWTTDPFAGECRPLSTVPVDVNGVEATFGIGPETAPHLFWRRGPVLYTLSGPFPKRTLSEIARSLQPVA